MLRILATPVLAVLGAIAGAIVGLILGSFVGALLVFAVSGWNPNPDLAAPIAVISLYLGALVGMALAVWRLGRKPQRDTSIRALESDLAAPVEPSSLTPSTRKWMVRLVLLWILIWILYTPSLLFPGPKSPLSQSPQPHAVYLYFAGDPQGNSSSFLFNIDDLCFDGVYDSVPSAAAFGGLLWIIVAAAGWRQAKRQATLTRAYVGLYVVGLALLWHYAPLIWGAAHCYTD